MVGTKNLCQCVYTYLSWIIKILRNHRLAWTIMSEILPIEYFFIHSKILCRIYLLIIITLWFDCFENLDIHFNTVKYETKHLLNFKFSHTGFFKLEHYFNFCLNKECKFLNENWKQTNSYKLERVAIFVIMF